MARRRKIAVVAIGGNSLIQDKSRPDVRYQWEAVRETTKHIAHMVEQGWNVVITHGNGPQVGFILRRSELAAGEVHTVPLDIIGADTQGSIGYMLQQALSNELRKRRIVRQVVTVVTQVLVDKDDPAFQNPQKPIGGFMAEGQARKFGEEGWNVVEDAGRGWRRVVASPTPLQIIELDAIRRLIEDDFVVVGVGGGGIPVVRNEKGELRGVYAVIDKDRASGLLAQGLHADLFLISTAVPQVAINFNKPDQEWLDHMTLPEAKEYLAEEHFAPGSMAPKIESVIRFLEAGGPQALITDPVSIGEALAGTAGTWITPE
jgi:carbamate kinase